jgi:hypothetical protein
LSICSNTCILVIIVAVGCDDGDDDDDDDDDDGAKEDIMKDKREGMTMRPSSLLMMTHSLSHSKGLFNSQAESPENAVTEPGCHW